MQQGEQEEVFVTRDPGFGGAVQICRKRSGYGFTGPLTVQPSVTETRRDSTETWNIPLIVRSGKSTWIGLN